MMMYVSSVDRFHYMHKFSMVSGYLEDLKKAQNCQNGVWALVWEWVLAWDNMVLRARVSEEKFQYRIVCLVHCSIYLILTQFLSS